MGVDILRVDHVHVYNQAILNADLKGERRGRGGKGGEGKWRGKEEARGEREGEGKKGGKRKDELRILLEPSC